MASSTALMSSGGGTRPFKRTSETVAGISSRDNCLSCDGREKTEWMGTLYTIPSSTVNTDHTTATSTTRARTNEVLSREELSSTMKSSSHFGFTFFNSSWLFFRKSATKDAILQTSSMSIMHQRKFPFKTFVIIHFFHLTSSNS